MRLKPSFQKNSTRLERLRGPGMAARLRGPSARPPARGAPGLPAPLSSARVPAGSRAPSGREGREAPALRNPPRPAAGLTRAFRIRARRAIAAVWVGWLVEAIVLFGEMLPFGVALCFSVFEQRFFELIPPGHQFTQTIIKGSLP